MMSGHLFWWVGVGVLVVAELLTGTFYLLMIALGFLVGGLLQLAGFAPHVQFGAAAAVAIVAMIVLRRSGLGRKQKRDTSTNPDVNLDIGSTVTVDAWRDGRARAVSRGRLGRRARARRARRCTRVPGERRARQLPRGRGETRGLIVR